MKKVSFAFIFALAAVILAVSGPALAVDSLDPTALEWRAGAINNEFNTEDLYYIQVRPTIVSGGLTAVLELNLFFNNDFKMRDSGNDAFLLSRLDYKRDNLRVVYDEIENLTFGSGFIVSNYRTNVRGNVPLNRQKAIDIETTSPRSIIKAFGTRTSLVGLRAVRNLGSITVGTTAVSDKDPDFNEYSIDALYTVLPDKLSVYGEVAKITDYGDGYAVGALTSFTKYADLKVEFREFDADFAPGIIDEHYESVNVLSRVMTATGTRRWGYYTSLDFAYGDNYKASITYEDYEDIEPRLAFYAEGTFRKRVRGSMYFAQQAHLLETGQVGNDAVARARVYYAYNPKLEFFVDYYNAYADDYSVMESFNLGAIYQLK